MGFRDGEADAMQHAGTGNAGHADHMTVQMLGKRKMTYFRINKDILWGSLAWSREIIRRSMLVAKTVEEIRIEDTGDVISTSLHNQADDVLGGV